MFSSKNIYTEDEISLSFCCVVGLLIRETYFGGYEDYFYMFTLQTGYIKVAANFPDEVLKDLKTLSSHTVNLMQIINLTEKLEHIICLNFCTCLNRLSSVSEIAVVFSYFLVHKLL